MRPSAGLGLSTASITTARLPCGTGNGYASGCVANWSRARQVRRHGGSAATLSRFRGERYNAAGRRSLLHRDSLLSTQEDQKASKQRRDVSGSLGLMRIRLFACGWCAAVLLFAMQGMAADRLILRNLTILSDRTVVEFNLDGVRLDDGRVVGWYDIERGQVSADKQAEFDRFLKEIGEPLFRVRQRLRVGDYRDLEVHVEPLYPRFAGRRSSTAYTVVQATMWSRIAQGRREAAVEPYFRAYEYVRAQGTQELDLPGSKRLEFNPRTGLTPALVPLWFDAKAAREAMPLVAKAAGEMAQPRPAGAYVYFATLALAAGDLATADRVLKGVPSDGGELGQLLEIIAVQREQVAGSTGSAGSAAGRLAARWSQFPAELHPLALYWLGQAHLRSEDTKVRQRGLLELLRIPAWYGESSPDLAAAALHAAMESLRKEGDSRGSIALRNELLVRYGQTYFAKQAETPPSR